MSLSHHKDDDVTDIVDHFASCLFLVFSYFFFEVEFKKDKVFIENFIKEPGPDTIREISIASIQAACLNTTLLAIRNIDDFFTPRSSKKRISKKDGLKASDLNYKGGSILTTSERDRINKIVMHSTVTAIKNYDASWDMQELCWKCVSQSLHFLNWVILNYPGEKHPKVWVAAIKYIQRIKMILTYAKRINAGNAS